MPRVENLGPEVDKYCQQSGDGSSTWDVCARCYRLYHLEDGTAVLNDRLVPYNGDPSGTERGGCVEHPPYEECDYTCEVCSKPLNENDN